MPQKGGTLGKRTKAMPLTLIQAKPFSKYGKGSKGGKKGGKR